MNLRYTAWKNGSVSAYGGVYSPRIMLQGKSSMYWYSNINVSQELFKKKLTASVSLSEPFRGRITQESSISDPNFNQKSKYYYTARALRVSLSYRFGQLKGEIKRAKRGIKNDDLKAGDSGSSGGGTQQN
jgi:hypothetical protein